MRFRKRPKVVVAVQAADILVAGHTTVLPQWLQSFIALGKVTIGAGAVNIIVGRTCKVARPGDWIVYDIERKQVYYVSEQTMAEDYEVMEGVPV